MKPEHFLETNGSLEFDIFSWLNPNIWWWFFLPAPTYGHPAPVAYKDETPKPYAFEYGVHDDYAGTNFAQNENADGSTASGSYSVLLPDGRTQTVTYHADQVKLYFIQLVYTSLEIP